ncbi:valine dehydrogenase (NAD) (EC 1.4.1.-) [Streptoalloteichus tenebrarius]|uniref:Valine dehydrogenase (NAD) n=1 Tax=Streptoalloteichus tenebrarius (strain ATCC 17920 / DSM 40477 / JCM 4838 / CBS 697.72 / NBRC 16177 / NCIMB 11028 / NRRL B-12390 / A12253. 1 / ISP 5477) TaxID=1933 RepID=A0ABT1HZP0_STRSD|nr:Glu/Leu/Phe/Val dehydrogenase dimerization domain-containing protein [Streptoalloteichus tenebrarius]MCP2261003.1 valine dehydrogenase (NAD) (EC 1.4.1.-) [Streptoalloteichus tenebrarius]BFE98944.1 Glu/Leu/Phe/Val dehydrogenase dimerization domain-containing protein [Streptoalloteichus tenebrarius]
MGSFSVMTPLAVTRSDSYEHEQVVLCQDPSSGLRAVIAIHSTALGPAVGGVRFHPYATDEEAVADVLNLSRGMSYKNALAGLDFGGGKAVIVGDPARLRSEKLLLAYGRFVASLGGRYVTGCDVGTDVADMDVITRVCRWVVCGSPNRGGTGDPSGPTALGVLQGMRAAAQHRWGSSSLRGRTVGVAGVGKVGYLLVGHLVEEGARVIVTDVREEAVRRVVDRFPGVLVVDDTETLVRTRGMDVYSPCALGGALDDAVVPVLTAEVVCGAANNQLAHPGIGRQLVDRGILYAPDYVVNAGGVIHSVAGLSGCALPESVARVERIFDTTLAVLERAEAEGVPPGVAADRIAEQRLTAAARSRAWHGPGRPAGS